MWSAARTGSPPLHGLPRTSPSHFSGSRRAGAGAALFRAAPVRQAHRNAAGRGPDGSAARPPGLRHHHRGSARAALPGTGRGEAASPGWSRCAPDRTPPLPAAAQGGGPEGPKAGLGGLSRPFGCSRWSPAHCSAAGTRTRDPTPLAPAAPPTPALCNGRAPPLASAARGARARGRVRRARTAGPAPSPSSSSFSSRAAAAAGPRGASTALGRAAQPASRTGEQRRGSGAQGSGVGRGKGSRPGPGEGRRPGPACAPLAGRRSRPRPLSVCLSVVASLPRGTWWGCGRPCPVGPAWAPQPLPVPARRRPGPGRGVPGGAAARALAPGRRGRGARAAVCLWQWQRKQLSVSSFRTWNSARILVTYKEMTPCEVWLAAGFRLASRRCPCCCCCCYDSAAKNPVTIWQQIFSMCSVSYVLARSLFGDSRLVCWTLWGRAW